MTAARHPVPRLRPVLGEQFRFVGLGVRRELLAGAAVLLALLVLVFLRREPVNFTRELFFWFAALGSLAPFAVWRGWGDPGEGQLWTLPVEHRRRALVGVAAGWFWLILAAGALLLWVVVAILLTGGHFGAEGTRMVLSPTGTISGPVDPGQLTAVEWRTPAWLWLVPFSAATATYLLGSAIVLATERPWRWVGGLALLVLLVVLLAQSGGYESLGAALGGIVTHPLGLETVLAGGTVSRNTAAIVLTTGERMLVWRSLPDPGRWATATLIWLAIGAAALWLATIRYRERERPLGEGS